MLDKYFKYPLLYDFIIAILMSIGFYKLTCIHFFCVPKIENLFSIISDLSTISLTMAGFILTLLTVLVSFKSSSKLVKDKIKDSDRAFDVFFASKLYFVTVGHLKNAIKSLVFISILGYLLKLTIEETSKWILFEYCIFGLTIILLSIARSLIILTNIIKIQETN